MTTMTATTAAMKMTPTANPSLYGEATRRLMGTALGKLWLSGLSVVLPWAANRSQRKAEIKAQWMLLWPVVSAFVPGIGFLVMLRHGVLPSGESAHYLAAGMESAVVVCSLPLALWYSLRALCTRVEWVARPPDDLVPGVSARAKKALGANSAVYARELMMTRRGWAAKRFGALSRPMGASVWVSTGRRAKYCLRLLNGARQYDPNLTYNVHDGGLSLAAE
jgi:hypothetical protein